MQSLLTLHWGANYQIIIDHDLISLLRFILCFLIETLQNQGHSLCHNNSIASNGVLISDYKTIGLSLLTKRNADPSRLISEL